jgi:DNA-binding beta-propeller fold protein YncE
METAVRTESLGTGVHTYELVPGWAKLPEGKQFGYTHGAAVDTRGRVFIHNMSSDAVVIFDPEGNFINSWGSRFKEGAHGMQLSRETDGEFLYLSVSSQHLVVKTTLDGEIVWTLEYPKESGLYESADQFVPTNLAIAPNGDFYVADGYGRGYIHQYNARAEYIRSWGGRGTEPGKMNCPHGIIVDVRKGEPRVLVADRGNVRLQYFTMEGEFLEIVTGDLRHPCHFDIRGDDLLIPDLHGRVTICGRENQLLTHLGDNPGVQTQSGYPNLPHEKRIPGRFISPHAAIWDSDGNIYVVEWISDGRVTKLRKLDSKSDTGRPFL